MPHKEEAWYKTLGHKKRYPDNQSTQLYREQISRFYFITI